MRILLAEPFEKGHTTVILKYCEKILPSLGVEICKPKSFEPSLVESRGGLVNYLQEVASELHCDLIHVLTIDYLLKAWAAPSWPLRKRGAIPLVANLYNYNNLLSSTRSLAMRWLQWRGTPERYFVSSSRLGSASAKDWQRDITHFIPDPYDPDEFPVLERQEARQRLGLSVRSEQKVFLVFGTLDPRKGFDQILEAFWTLKDLPDWQLVCAGGVARKELTEHSLSQLRQLVESGRCTLFEGFVDEKIVSPLFHATDFVVTAYPRWYEISSGNLTRACAAGRPSVCANHGEVGTFVQSQRCGLTFGIDQPGDLLRALRDALALSAGAYQESSQRARAGALGRDLATYGAALVAGYRQVLGGSR